MADKKKTEKIEPEIKPRWEDFDKTEYVNLIKAERAFKAVYGGAKPQTVEVSLAQALRSKYKGDELVKEVYKGMGGLIDVARAKKNRENEARDLKQRSKK